jgi:hypothetical protein
MNTTDIMNIALELAGFKEVPGDSEIFYHGENIKRILFGIDISDDDLSKAEELGADLVISHHSPNRAWRDEYITVLDRQVEFMVSAGVPLELAQEAVAPIKKRYMVDRSEIREHTLSLAQRLDMPLMNIHQPCDELGRKILHSVMQKLGDDRPVSELLNGYNEIPEIRESGSNAELVCGDLNSRVGKGIVMHGAGTDGGYPVATALFDHGVATVVYIHLTPRLPDGDDRERLIEDNKGNLIDTGHYPSDAVGINPFIRELERRGLEIIRCNGL